MRYSVRVIVHAVVLDVATGEARSPDEGELVEMLDGVMGQLVADGVADPDISAEGADVEISITVDSADIGAANHDGLVAMRTAVHAAGVGTPGWTIDMSEVAAHEDEFAEQLRWVEVGVRGVDLVDV